jgi:hypothetical protein
LYMRKTLKTAAATTISRHGREYSRKRVTSH